MTNFDKVKEMMDIEEVANYYNLLCKTIYKLQGKEYCYCNCDKCYEWLKQEYKEPPKPILTDKEKEYLSSVIKPFRDRIRYIMKEENSENEWISITMEDWSKQGVKDCLTFPNFQLGTMYKNMDTIRAYTLEELGL